MANRRMYSKAIVRKGKFLKMAKESRLLYFDLGLDADDDGVVDVVKCMRTTEASTEALNELTAKGFLIPLKTDDEDIYLIADWRINNLLRKDRCTPSLHKSLLDQHFGNNQESAHRQPNDNQMTTNGCHSIGEYRVEKDSVEKGECKLYALSPADKAVLISEGIPEHYLSDQTRIIRAGKYAQEHNVSMLTTYRAFWQKDKEQEQTAQASYGDGDDFLDAALKAGLDG